MESIGVTLESQIWDKWFGSVYENYRKTINFTSGDWDFMSIWRFRELILQEDLKNEFNFKD